MATENKKVKITLEAQGRHFAESFGRGVQTSLDRATSGHSTFVVAFAFCAGVAISVGIWAAYTYFRMAA